jgi:protein-tyrosine phosphatase
MPVKILMVCLGNICRSPLAQGILASKLPENKFIVDSAGTGSWYVGHAPDVRSVAIAKKNNLNISSQKGRQFTTADFDTFDYIFVMDNSNYKNVIELSKKPIQTEKVQLILNELFPDENLDVPDPFYGLSNGFEIVYKMLDESCTILAEKLIAKHQ